MNAHHAFQSPRIDPVALRIGPLAVHWYGLAYVLGFALCYVGLRVMIARGILRLTPEDLGDFLLWSVIGVVAGGRTGWWIFYHRSAATPEPWYEPFAAWHGGMSFHGGLLGVAVAAGIWTHLRHASFWNVADCVALVAPMGLFFGRLANFVNAELVGRAATVPWAVVFPGDPTPRHPSQLYEAMLEGPVLLGLLWAAKALLPARDGAIASIFLCLYALFRMFAELFRQPDPQLGFIAFGWLTMGQLLSFAIMIAGVVLFIRCRRSRS